MKTFADLGVAADIVDALSAQQIVNYYNDYFGVPFPLPKLDEIAVPGGFGGAMENWGGITYFETALLFDPAISSTQTARMPLR